MSTATLETCSFQAEVTRLLEIVANSLYSNKEIFLRELISNASDACDRLRYVALTEPELTAEDPDFKVVLRPDRDGRRLTISDNGIGMNRDDLIENLGTIAKSGTAAFVRELEDRKEGASLIGQFGVGFYSAFMVAERVEVFCRKAGESEGWKWSSDGRGEFTIEPSEEAPARGTRIVLHLRKGEEEYVEGSRLKQIVKTYSDHIAMPVLLEDGTEGGEEERLNRASALWTRPASEIDEDQYKEFYHHVGQAFDDPWVRLHFTAEGVLQYTCLLFIPSMKPFDLFHPDRRHGVRLYVRRVFITDDCSELVPAYLRFLKGVVDTEDLPLNVSRELLQHNPVLAKIRKAVVKKVLSELKKRASKDEEGYTAFWNNFGAVLKEGIYEDEQHRGELMELVRFRSTATDGVTSLKGYVERMKDGQDAIYYITGDDTKNLARSPQLEGFAAKGVEVLLLTDPVDEFWLTVIPEFEGKAFKSVTRGGVDLGRIDSDAPKDAKEKEGEETPDDAKLESLVSFIKLTLKDEVKDVRASERLTTSAACLVADEGDMDIHLERMLKQHRQLDQAYKRILEINPRHPMIRRMAECVGNDGAGERVAQVAFLLLDQARILEGEPLNDPAAFSERLTRALERGLE